MRFLAVFNIIYLALATKLCRHCRFYLPENVGGKYEVGHYFSKCMKFGFINTNTSEIEYSYSFMSRDNENQCGKDAKYYMSLTKDQIFYSE